MTERVRKIVCSPVEVAANKTPSPDPRTQCDADEVFDMLACAENMLGQSQGICIVFNCHGDPNMQSNQFGNRSAGPSRQIVSRVCNRAGFYIDPTCCCDS